MHTPGMSGELSRYRPATLLSMPPGVLRRCRRPGPGGPAVAATAARDAGKTRRGAMGHRQSLITPERQLRAQRAQQMSLIYTVMACLVSLIFVQFLLLTVALEGYLCGRVEVALPTALVSGLGCAGASWLLRSILMPGRRCPPLP